MEKATISVLKNSEQSVDAPSDRQLLNAVVSRASHDCFGELMRRHGTMVVNVCQRQLGNRHDAEDAAQAVFIVLWNKARTLEQHESLAGWLHQVAINVCRNSRKMTARRLAREKEAAEMTKPHFTGESTGSKNDPWDLFKDVLDEEVNRLPEKYRLPLILYHLQGKSHEEVAAIMGRNVSTIATRLSRARKMLSCRFERKGIKMASTALMTSLSANAASADMGSELIRGIQSESIVFSNGSESAAAVSKVSTTLASATIKSLWIAKVKFLATIAATALIVTATGLAVFNRRNQVALTRDLTALESLNQSSPIVKLSEVDESQTPIIDAPHSLPVADTVVSSRTYYVNRNHAEANDSNGGTRHRPWKTIGRAIGSVHPGDRVIVSRGRYTEAFRPNVSGIQGHPIRWQADADGGVILTQNRHDGGAAIELNKLQHVMVAGFTIENVGQGIEVNECAFVKIRECKFHEIDTIALQLKNTHNSTVIDNVIRKTGRRQVGDGKGIVCRGFCSQIYIRGNDISETNGAAIELMPSTLSCDVVKNHVHDVLLSEGASINVHPAGNRHSPPRHEVSYNSIARVLASGHDGGVGLRLSTSCGVVNNVIYDCEGAGIRIDDPAGEGHLVVVVHNTLFSNAGGSIRIFDNANVTVANNLGVNSDGNMAAESAYFVDAAAGDFHLVAGSRPIDAVGGPHGRIFYEVAHDGVARPFGQAADMGAFEFVE